LSASDDHVRFLMAKKQSMKIVLRHQIIAIMHKVLMAGHKIMQMPVLEWWWWWCVIIA
jgi:hypothetical protein